jgi:PAS domain S-box-containing protein
MEKNKKEPEITERKRAEEALQESEEQLRDSMENAPDGIYLNDLAGNFLYGNRKTEEILGYRRDELIGKNMMELNLLPSNGLAKAAELLQESIKGKPTGPDELTLVRKDGKHIIVEINTSLTHRQGRPAVIGFVRDITERKRMEEALKESEGRLRDITFSLAEWVWEVDARGFYTFSSVRGSDILGRRPEEIIGKTPFDFMPPDEAKRVGALFSEIVAKKAPIKDLENWNIGKNDERICLLTNGVPILDAAGDLKGYRGVDKDITERKRAENEIRRTSEELQEKNAELNRFIYAVSHDLKSPLVTIQTFQGHLEQDIQGKDAERIKTDLGYIRTAADKMSRLLDEIRNLSRVGRISNPSVESPLQAIVKEALDLVAGRLTTRGVRVDVTEEPVVLYGDRTRLVEVFQNLVDNAVKFMGHQPSPRIEIGMEQAGEEMALYVRDNGIGISRELRPLVFGLFRKLDPASEGEGLGLALVKRIVEVHGGRIWVESDGPGKGTTFRFTLAKTKRAAG